MIINSHVCFILYIIHNTYIKYNAYVHMYNDMTKYMIRSIRTSTSVCVCVCTYSYRMTSRESTGSGSGRELRGRGNRRTCKQAPWESTSHIQWSVSSG